MMTTRNGLIYETIVNGFILAKLLMRQRPHIKGIQNLENLPKQVIFAITHDSYFEIPSLTSVYKAITPRPEFTVMAKEDFLSGRYLSTNFFKESTFASGLLKMVDMTGAPKAVFEKLNLISIPRPFADAVSPEKKKLKSQISNQFAHFRERISEGFSTLIFPEGTTWGYGGLRKIRSAVYQLVSTSFDQYDKKIYILPINVKVDRLVKGWKDVFINVGKPQFFIKSKDEFNQQLFQILQRLHTITFSQIAAFHFKRLAHFSKQTNSDIKIAKNQLITNLEKAVEQIHQKVKSGILPEMDNNLLEKHYLYDKVEQFILYCERNKYLSAIKDKSDNYRVNVNKILSNYPKRLFRKKNPVSFHANELASLGDSVVETSFREPSRQVFISRD